MSSSRACDTNCQLGCPRHLKLSLSTFEYNVQDIYWDPRSKEGANVNSITPTFKAWERDITHLLLEIS